MWQNEKEGIEQVSPSHPGNRGKGCGSESVKLGTPVSWGKEGKRKNHHLATCHMEDTENGVRETTDRTLRY